ncbi:MAG: hypothetical protein GX991_06230 [Clostridiaceae bacterium]|nr:hypothetical protein [Clostridiaceae bacterium]
MKRYELLDAIGGIDPTYVETADRDDKVGKKRVWKTLVPIAACLCLAVGMISIVKYAQLRKATTPPESTGDGTGASATQASADATASTNATDMNYTIISLDWSAYESAHELVEAGNIVVLGKISGISFQMYDIKTGRPHSADSYGSDIYLHTVYEIETLSFYKGEPADTIHMRMIGGLKDVMVNEQRALRGDCAKANIPLLAGMPELDIGQTYLFVLHQHEDTMPTLLTPSQGVYTVEDPEQKDVLSLVSLKDIISYFGDDKWSAFEQTFGKK